MMIFFLNLPICMLALSPGSTLVVCYIVHVHTVHVICHGSAYTQYMYMYVTHIATVHTAHVTSMCTYIVHACKKTCVASLGGWLCRLEFSTLAMNLYEKQTFRHLCRCHHQCNMTKPRKTDTFYRLILDKTRKKLSPSFPVFSAFFWFYPVLISL